jgi:hypothetical protein
MTFTAKDKKILAKYVAKLADKRNIDLDTASEETILKLMREILWTQQQRS